MASESRERDSGGSQDRNEVLRQRQEVLGVSRNLAEPEPELEPYPDEGSNSDDDDEQWHRAKKLPFVDIGMEFSIMKDGIVHNFKRAGGREADCVRCGRSFNVNSYHLRAPLDHGVKCSNMNTRSEELATAAALRDAWSGELVRSHEFTTGDGADEVIVAVRFQKFSFSDKYRHALRCQCGMVNETRRANRRPFFL